MATLATRKRQTLLTEQDFASMPTPRLWDTINSNLNACAEHFVMAAACIRVIDERGEDTSRLSANLLANLRKIGAGLLLPEAMVKFGHSPGCLNAISSLPLARQQELLDNPDVEVVKQTSHGTVTKTVPLVCLRQREIAQVFGGTGIRTPRQQKELISPSAAPHPETARWISVRLTKWEYDKLFAAAQEEDVTPGEILGRLLRTHGIA